MLPDELPEGWAATTVAEVCALNPKHDKDLPDDLVVSFVPMASVSDELGEIVEQTDRPLGEVRRGYTHFADGDVVWAKITPCMQNGKSAVASGLTNGLGCGTTEFFVLRTKGAILPEYLHRFMRQAAYLHEAQHAMTGAVGQARVPKEFVLNTELPLPPLAEQHRVMAKLDALEERRRAIKARLDRLPGLLERYRQSVLAAAFRGDLTVGWRQRHPDTEPAEVLLEKIRAERRRRWVETEAEKATQRAEACADKQGHPWDEATRAARLAQERTKAEKKYRAPEPVDTTDLPDLPDGWVWTSVDESTEVLDSVRVPVNASERDARIAGLEEQELFPYYGATGQVGWIDDFLLDDDLVLLGEDGAPFLDPAEVAYRVEGKVWVNNHAHILKGLGGLSNSFLVHYLNAIDYRKYVSGSTRLKLTQAQMRLIPVPLPPQDELDEITRLVDALLDGASEIRAKASRLAEQVDMLHQATLARAFRGELVPTEAELARREGRDYEHAEALLARVRAERNGRPKPAQRRAKRGSGPTPPAEGDGHEEPPIAFRMNASGAPVRVDPGGQGRLDL